MTKIRNNQQMPQLFNFDEVIDRRNTRSVKWDEAHEGELPLWVADMDFATAPCVREAVARRAMHPCYGYTLVPDAYYQSIIRWFWERHEWHIHREEILYTIGVVPAIAAALKAVVQPGDNVVMLTPIYNCFYNLVRNAGCQALSVPLVVRDDNRISARPHTPFNDEAPCASALAGYSSADEALSSSTLSYTIDWDALEQALSHEKSTVLLLCNPHNPVGRIWTEEELRYIASLCRRHEVLVISDEIHNELTRPGSRYTPWGTIGEEWQAMSIICTSPSKSFNIAGLQNANVIVRDAELRRRIDRAINLNETCDVNPFGVEAVMAAYDQGAEWLDALRRYIWSNYAFACAYLNKELPALRIADLQATYLMWVDFSQLLPAQSSTAVSRRLRDEAHVWFAAGTAYGKEGETCLRINIATTRANLTEALKRFVEWVRTNS